MKLYYSPGACSIGIHLLLEEIGEPYEAQRLSLQSGEQHKPDFAAVNPKAKVPTLLRDDGSVLTEYGAIATWLARAYPAATLLPLDIEGEVRAREMLDYCVGTMQKDAYGRLFRPSAYASNPDDQAAIKLLGREIAEKGYALLEHSLVGKDYVCGQFSIADSAMFYIELWSGRAGIPLPPNCARHLSNMLARASTTRVMRDEGLA
jgi:glutathione S-transferase